ncbi:MAG: HAD-IA family hydrolase [Bacteroidota bacterium]
MKKAVIFDMDGVIINSESIWQTAEKEVFSTLGVIMDEESCAQTQSMTTNEVTRFWFSKNPWQGKGFVEVEQLVIDRVIELIQKEDCVIDGIQNTVHQLKARNLKIGLATNSPFRIIPEVLSKSQFTCQFDAITSAEFENHGKPDPSVYFTTSRKLEEFSQHCVAIEDSNSGIMAAKQAGMTVIGFTNEGRNTDLSNTDHTIDSYSNVDWDLYLQ